MAVSYSKAGLIGAIMECMAYGIYFALFVQSLNVLRQKMIQGRLSLYLLMTHGVLFFLITLRMVLDNILNVTAFTDNPDVPGAAEIQYRSFDGALFRTGTYVALTIVADLFIVYRAYVVWNKDWRAGLGPALLSIGSIVSGGLFLDALTRLVGGQDPTTIEITQRILVFYSFTMALNVISTILIAYRVWSIQRKVSGAREGLMGARMSVNSSFAIFAESSVLYSVSLILTIIFTAIQSNIQYCLLSALPGIIGISFSLIITRVGSGQSPDTAGPTSTNSIRFRGQATTISIPDHKDLPTSTHISTQPTNTDNTTASVATQEQGVKLTLLNRKGSSSLKGHTVSSTGTTTTKQTDTDGVSEV